MVYLLKQVHMLCCSLIVLYLYMSMSCQQTNCMKADTFYKMKKERKKVNITKCLLLYIHVYNCKVTMFLTQPFHHKTVTKRLNGTEIQDFKYMIKGDGTFQMEVQPRYFNRNCISFSQPH